MAFLAASEASEFQGDDRRPDRCSSDRGGSRSGALNRKQRWEPGRRHYAQKEGMLRSASVKLHAAPGTLACCTTTLHAAPAAAATGLARLHCACTAAASARLSAGA